MDTKSCLRIDLLTELIPDTNQGRDKGKNGKADDTKGSAEPFRVRIGTPKREGEKPRCIQTKAKVQDPLIGTATQIANGIGDDVMIRDYGREDVRDDGQDRTDGAMAAQTNSSSGRR